MKIAHFNVDVLIKPFLTGPVIEDALTPDVVQALPNYTEIEGISIKYSSTVSEDIIALLPALKVVVTRSVGIDHLDLALLKKHNIAVFNIPDYGSYNIAEFAVGMLIAGARNIVTGNQETHQGIFDYSHFPGLSIKGKTIGVVGTGKIGIEFIKRMSSFEARIIAFDAFPNQERAEEYGFTYVSLDELWQQSDFISLHVPLLDSTRHLISDESISRMKDGVVLVNTARGEVIDTQALERNITKFKSICLDVVEGENEFGKEHSLLKYSNVIVTPHIGFLSDASLDSIGTQTNDTLERALQGDLTGQL